MITIRTFVNNTEAWLARSLLESEGIHAEVTDNNMNAGYASMAMTARLQVAEEDKGRALEVLDKHEAFTPLPDDFVPSEPAAELEDEPPPGLPRLVLIWARVTLCMLVAIAGAAALYMWFAPLSWRYGEGELVRMGNAASDKKDYDAALKYYNAVLASDPADGPALYDRGLAYYDKHDYTKAIEDFSEDLKIRPDHRPDYSMRGRAYVNTGQMELALADLNKAISLDPDSGAGYRGRAFLYEHSEEWEKAAGDLDTAIRMDPKDYQAYSHRGYVNHRRGLNEEALADENKALELKPDNDAPRVNRGLAYAGMEEYDKALADIDEVITHDPMDSVIFVDRSFVFEKMGEYGKALDDANKSIEIDPKDAIGYLNRAGAYAKLGDALKALADCDRALELGYLKWHVYNQQAWIYSTTPLAESRNGKKAMELATEACELTQWKQCRTIGTLAAAEAEIGKFGDAVKHATQALAMAQDDKTLSKRERAEMADALKAYQQGMPYRDPAK